MSAARALRVDKGVFRVARVPCARCGTLFYRPPSRLTSRLCSHKCRDAEKTAKRINIAEGTAKCARCKQWLPITAFVRGSGGRPHSYCKPCSSQWFHERRGTPVEKRAAYIPTYRLTDEEKRSRKRDANRLQHMARRAAGDKPGRFDVGRMLCMQDARCFYCGKILTEYHIDHKTPISKGGTNALTNLHLTCPTCNMRKGAMTHDEFLASKRRPVRSWT